jgi:hypothetical protein
VIHLSHLILVIFKLDGTAVDYSRSTKVLGRSSWGSSTVPRCERLCLGMEYFRKIVVFPYYVCLPEPIYESYCQIHSPFHVSRDHQSQAMVPDDALHRYDGYAWYYYPRPLYEYTCTPGSDSQGQLPRGYP